MPTEPAEINESLITSKTRGAFLTSTLAILKKRREALRRLLDSDIKSLTANGDSKGDPIDAALDAAQKDITSELAEHESAELACIEDAIARMRDGTYGICLADKDGEPHGRTIPEPRLRALPYTTECIDCRREAEARGEV